MVDYENVMKYSDLVKVGKANYDRLVKKVEQGKIKKYSIGNCITLNNKGFYVENGKAYILLVIGKTANYVLWETHRNSFYRLTA